MAISEKKPKSYMTDYNIDDCKNVLKIYLKTKRKAVSKNINVQEMLHEIRLAFAAYKIAEHQDRAPTTKQLRKQHADIRTKAQKLLIDLQEKTDTHFLNSLASSIAGTKTPLDIEDKEYKILMLDIYKNIESLGESLKWLIDNLNHPSSEKFNYLHTKLNPSARSSAENYFTSNLALVLTKHLGGGGYAHDIYKDKYDGWKIECIKYLLERVKVDRTKGQIFAILNAHKRKKKVNKTSQ